jgi:ribonuclease R
MRGDAREPNVLRAGAVFIASHEYPVRYRVHVGPTPEKEDHVAELPARDVGPGPEHQRRSEAGADFQANRGRLEGSRRLPSMIHTMMLRSMQQAIYTPINSAISVWPTTPMPTSRRRSDAIPDLLVHRVIKSISRASANHLHAPTGELASRRAQDHAQAANRRCRKWSTWVRAPAKATASRQRSALRPERCVCANGRACLDKCQAASPMS